MYTARELRPFDELMTEADLEMELREEYERVEMEEDHLPVYGPFPAEDHSDELPF